MERQHTRSLDILTAIGEGVPLTQRAPAARLGVALGPANLYLKRLSTKGFIKATEFPAKPLVGKRLRYLLTPRGLAEKTRLTGPHDGDRVIGATFDKPKRDLPHLLALGVLARTLVTLRPAGRTNGSR